MLARLSAFVIWALVAATAVFWGLRLFVNAQAAPAYAVPVGDTAVVRGDLTRLLGSAPVAAVAAAAAPQAASRFKLLGIVAPKSASTSDTASTRGGVALIAVDGKMAKAFPVGARVDTDLVLQSVSLRTVSIASTAQGAPTITLELPPLAAAATGTLPANLGGGAPFTPPAPVPQYVPPYVPPAPPLAAPPAPQAPPPNRPESTAPTQ